LRTRKKKKKKSNASQQTPPKKREIIERIRDQKRSRQPSKGKTSYRGGATEKVGKKKKTLQRVRPWGEGGRNCERENFREGMTVRIGKKQSAGSLKKKKELGRYDRRKKQKKGWYKTRPRKIENGQSFDKSGRVPGKKRDRKNNAVEQVLKTKIEGLEKPMIKRVDRATLTQSSIRLHKSKNSNEGYTKLGKGAWEGSREATGATTFNGNWGSTQ